MSMGLKKIIKIMILSDFVLSLGWGLVSPVFAIFIVEKIVDNLSVAAKTAGFASLCYLVTKAIFQLPLAKFLDKRQNQKDIFFFLVTGTILASIVPIGYLFSSRAWHIFFWQTLFGFSMAMAHPSWLVIFTKHLDKGKETMEWALETTFLAIGSGIAGLIGGLIVASFGFKVLFILVSFLTLSSSFLLFLIKDEILFPAKKVVDSHS